MTQEAFQRALAALAADTALWSDFVGLCDCGGRQAGSASEQAALAFIERRLAAIDPRATRIETAPYAGWRLQEAKLTLAESNVPLACNALLGSQSTPAGGTSAEVLDLGRGTLEQLEARAGEIPGRFVLVRHEYPFSAEHLHRRRKYGWAMERGAAGFIIANPHPGAGPVSGSSGRGGAAGIPAVGTDGESAARLAARDGRLPRAHLTIAGEDFEGETRFPVLELPGTGNGWVVLSAHLDGHALAESAMDNASGAAVVLAVARAFAPAMAGMRRGLKVCLFSAEEWALAGSRAWLDRMSAAERSAVALNVNLDTVAGDGRLTALTSEFPALGKFVQESAAAVGMPVGIHLPMMANSDHFNFARHGVPALRLVAGFERPECNVRHILTGADTRDKVAPGELQDAARLAAALVWRGLTAADEELQRLKRLDPK
jgi:Zn-dependent M28 family amino/carboxypeptidase